MPLLDISDLKKHFKNIKAVRYGTCAVNGQHVTL